MIARGTKRGGPGFVRPCLATAVQAPPDREGWLHEIKYDGYRVEVLLDHGRLRILTRNGHDWTARFGVMAAELGALGVETAVIDGEAVVLDANGASRFGLLQAELKRGAAARIQMMAFDLLHLDGRDVASLPLIERKVLLSRMIAGAPLPHAHLRYVDHVTGAGPEFLAKACAMGLEGIVSKRADRPYRSGRNGDWTKAKCFRTDPFVVIGYTTQTGTRDLIGALVLGFYEESELVYAGRVGTGFTVAEARAMADGLAAITSPPPAFVSRLRAEQRSGVTWIRPILVAQVAYRDVTPDDLLRHAVFQHLRTDTPAHGIGRPAAFPLTP